MKIEDVRLYLATIPTSSCRRSRNVSGFSASLPVLAGNSIGSENAEVRMVRGIVVTATRRSFFIALFTFRQLVLKGENLCLKDATGLETGADVLQKNALFNSQTCPALAING